MPSNKELIDDILAINPEEDIQGQTNAQLVDTLKKLRAAKGETGAEEEAPPAPAAKSSDAYVVAEGHSLSVHKLGIVGPGKEVQKEWFSDDETFAKLIAKKVIVK